MVTKGEGEAINCVCVKNIHTAIYKITNKDLLYNIGNYTQYLVIEKNLK